jgi:hypothetical protein
MKTVVYLSLLITIPVAGFTVDNKIVIYDTISLAPLLYCINPCKCYYNIPLHTGEDTLKYCNDLYTGIGPSSGGTWEGAIRLTPDELSSYSGWELNAVIFYHFDSSSLDNIAKIYDDSLDDHPGGIITTEPYTTDSPGWVRIDLSNPVLIEGTKDIWCSIKITNDPGEYPYGIDNGPLIDGKGGWLYFTGTWMELNA